jgi:hypothetical protein
LGLKVSAPFIAQEVVMAFMKSESDAMAEKITVEVKDKVVAVLN